MIGIIAILLWVVSVIGYIIYNLYQKNLKLENIVVRQQTLIYGISGVIAESEKVMKQLDDKIWMEGEKDIAAAFQNLRAIQDALNQFRVN
jgi:hypothetical protein